MEIRRNEILIAIEVPGPNVKHPEFWFENWYRRHPDAVRKDPRGRWQIGDEWNRLVHAMKAELAELEPKLMEAKQQLEDALAGLEPE